MKVLAINGSPQGPRGNTECILQPFLEGAREVGAETEVIYLRDLEIKHCIGCFTCWTKTPGVCVHKDDMTKVLSRLAKAEMVVYATPLYVFTMSGLMKDMMDRMIPMAQPYIVERGNHYIHPPRYPQPGSGKAKMVLISNSGYPERHHFSGLEETFRRWADSPDEELAGVICCAGGALMQSQSIRDTVSWYTDAAREAGRQVVEQGRISPETQEILDRPLIGDPQAYVDILNAYWQSQGIEIFDPNQPPEEAATPAVGTAVPLGPPRSRDTMRDLVAGMAHSLDPQAAGDLQAVIQFDVTDEPPEHYYLDIDQGKCTACEGQHAAPKMTIHTPSDVWMAISRGEIAGPAALMSGEYRVEGDLGLLMRLGELFGKE
jgi:multimeric flavodoxin WrbA/putative sterol carrier protein